MRTAIRALPHGTYRSEIWIDLLGEELRCPLALPMAGENITVDFSGAPPQIGRHKKKNMETG